VLIPAATFTWRYRRAAGPRPPRKATSRAFHTLTSGGTLVLFVGLWTVGFHQYTSLREAPHDALQVWVVARQWMWQFASEDGMRSEGVLVVPLHRDVRLVITTRDVIHSFFVPAFRLKQDAVPGMTTSAWFRAERVGSHPVLCAEYCGTRHASMGASVVVLSVADYARYRDRQLAVVSTAAHDAREAPESEMSSRGRRVAETAGCLGCHSLEGSSALAPSLAGLWQSAVSLDDGSTTRADTAYLTESLMEPDAAVVNGYRRGSMPSYQGVLAAGDVAAIVVLIRSLSETTP
jgi:cytochrome c oxidase subunit 2